MYRLEGPSKSLPIRTNRIMQRWYKGKTVAKIGISLYYKRILDQWYHSISKGRLVKNTADEEFGEENAVPSKVHKLGNKPLIPIITFFHIRSIILKQPM